MIRPAKYAVRYTDKKNSIDADNLKTSIRQHGLLQPIVIRPLEQGFEIVAGHRRFIACKSLRWRFIPCKIREFSDKQAYEIQLTENIQRKSMDPIEEAEAYHRYVVDFGWGGVGDLASKIGKSEEYVSHRMQLLRLPEEVKEKITTNHLSISQALELTTAGESLQTKLADEIISNKLTIKQIRKIKSTNQEPVTKNDSKHIQIAKKSTLALKVTLSRLDDLIEDAHNVTPKQRVELIKMLMDLRRQTHAMIDETIRYQKKIK